MKSILTLLFLKIQPQSKGLQMMTHKIQTTLIKSLKQQKNAIENEFEQASFNLFDSEAMTSEIEEQIKNLNISKHDAY